jgi:protein-S-isoprenylcysteine O-methyltransferase Ste14
VAFEILDPLPPFSHLSHTRRIIYVVLATAAIAALIWACDTASRAPELLQAQQAKRLEHR